MGFDQNEAYFRFYGGLNDFLPPARQQSDVRYRFKGRPAVKDAIEAQGIPHPEVDLILRNGEIGSFTTPLRPGDHISVYPRLKPSIRPDGSLQPERPSPLRFVCDVHLGALARRLRMLGLDTWYESTAEDQELAEISIEERRILCTRDLELLKRKRVRLGTFVRSTDPDSQLEEMVERFSLDEEQLDLFSRCLTCNAKLISADDEAVSSAVPPHAQKVNDDFQQCPACDALYWEGSHVTRMRRLIERVLTRTAS